MNTKKCLLGLGVICFVQVGLIGPSAWAIHHRYDENGNRTRVGRLSGAHHDETQDPKRQKDHAQALEKHHTWRDSISANGQRPAPVNEKEAGLIQRFSNKQNNRQDKQSVNQELSLAKKDRAARAAAEAHEQATKLSAQAIKNAEVEVGNGSLSRPGSLGTSVTSAIQAHKETTKTGKEFARKAKQFEDARTQYLEVHPPNPAAAAGDGAKP